MDDCILREVAVFQIFNKIWTKTDEDGYIWVLRRDVIHALDDIPAADVRPVDAISDSVDEAIAFLNSVSNQMPYHVYSALFDLIYAILPTCGADMREVKSDEK